VHPHNLSLQPTASSLRRARRTKAFASAARHGSAKQKINKFTNGRLATSERCRVDPKRVVLITSMTARRGAALVACRPSPPRRSAARGTHSSAQCGKRVSSSSKWTCLHCFRPVDTWLRASNWKALGRGHSNKLTASLFPPWRLHLRRYQRKKRGNVQ